MARPGILEARDGLPPLEGLDRCANKSERQSLASGGYQETTEWIEAARRTRIDPPGVLPATHYFPRYVYKSGLLQVL